MSDTILDAIRALLDIHPTATVTFRVPWAGLSWDANLSRHMVVQFDARVDGQNFRALNIINPDDVPAAALVHVLIDMKDKAAAALADGPPLDYVDNS